MTFLKRLFLLTLFLSLTHCVNLQPTEPVTIIPGKTWVMTGKIAVKNEDTQAGESGYIRWQQVADHYDIEVMGTLGLGAKRLIGNAHTATLLDSSGSVVTAGGPEALMQKHFGWSLPAAAFQAWVEGKPAPAIPHKIHKNKAGQIDQLQQLGWQLHFDAFEAGKPTRIILSKAPLRIKLIINERKRY